MHVESFVRLHEIENGIYQLTLDAPKASFNILSKAVVAELMQAIKDLPVSEMKGLIITSAKKSFVAGADITEFRSSFSGDSEQIFEYGMSVQKALNTIEDLPFPTLTAINGEALGGGCEFALSTDFRVATENARIGLPEVNLGIMPGWGGSVRLPRLVGVDNALAWMTQGRPNKAKDALKIGAVDAVVEEANLNSVALQMLKDAIAGKLDYQSRKSMKTEPLGIPEVELEMACSTAAGMLRPNIKQFLPSAEAIINSVKATVNLPRLAAEEFESREFIKLATSQIANSLVQLFISEQSLKGANKKWLGDAAKVSRSSVLGAGIMGGGVAYQSASTGTPILMKDISRDSLELGMQEANRLMQGNIKRGKWKPEQAIKVGQSITPTLDYHGFDQVDMVVEAVVEDANIKRSVLAEVEKEVQEGTVVATNTSTLTVDELSTGLQRPENFCGMHFFNPVHKMPLVEIIRGSETSDVTIATAVSYALSMKKVPVVVGDCPGFLVNRILLPYIHAFTRLVIDGADFRQIDKVMEKFGWPMGPATLMDIVGMDTGCHAAAVMGQAYPDRMSDEVKNATHILHDAGRLGQKSGAGYYRYELDKKGRSKKISDPEVDQLIAPIVQKQDEFDEQTIINRLMIPLCLEAVRCLDDGIAEAPAHVDVALMYGIGFPRHLGGVFGYIDSISTQEFVELCKSYADLGVAYQPTESLLKMAESNCAFYQV